MRLLAALVVVPLLALPGTGAGQGPFSPDGSGPLVLEQDVRERWLPLARDPRFVPFVTERRVTELRWRGPGPSEVLRFHTLVLEQRNVGARLSLDPTGRIIRASVTLPPLQYSVYDDDARHARWRRSRLVGGEVLLRLPVLRFAEIPFPSPPGPLVTGMTWTDTLTYVAAPGDGMEERLEGVWRHEVVGDSVVAGGAHPVVRTRAEVHYRARDPFEDASIDGTPTRTRELSGTLTGRAVLDTVMNLRLLAADTASWEGESVIDLPDGRRLRQPARFERTRAWVLRDSAGWAARRDSLRAERDRRRSGMLIIPTDPMAERLRRGEPGLMDSLLGAWTRTDDPGERRRLLGAVDSWAARDTADPYALERRLWRLRLEAGDTASVLTELADVRPGRPLTDEDLDVLLPWLDDAAALHRIGALGEFAWAGLAEQLRRSWPIAGDETGEPPCTPAACRRLVALRETAREPRLRDVGLVLSYLENPVLWHDRVEARSAEGSRIVRQALAMGRGVGATWPAAPNTPLPEPGASWRAWLEWMGGEVRFESTHRRAIRLFEARTGRDVSAQLLERWPPPVPEDRTAEADSAALVIGTVLERLGALADATPDELAEMFRSGSPAELARASHGLRKLLSTSGRAAEPGLVLELLVPLVDSIVAGGDAPWPAVEGLVDADGGRVLHGAAVSSHGIRGVPRFLLDENLPTELDLPSRIPLTVISREAWEARPKRRGGWLLSFDPVRVAGPFVDLSWRWTVFEERAPDEAPSGYAGGGGLRLLRTGSGWRVVARRAWIT